MAGYDPYPARWATERIDCTNMECPENANP